MGLQGLPWQGEAGILATVRYDAPPPTTTDLRFINWLVAQTTAAYEARGHRVRYVTPILSSGYWQLWIYSPDGDRLGYAAASFDDEHAWTIVDRGIFLGNGHPNPPALDPA